MRNLPARHGVRGFGAVGLCGFWRSSFATLTHRSVCREFAELCRASSWWREKCTRPPSAATAAHERPSAAAHSTHRHYPHEQPTMLYFARGIRGVAGVGREGQIFGVVEFLAEMVHFVDLFRPKLRPWLGRSSVQREAGRASCAGAAATLGPQTSFCEASQCGRQG